MAEAGPQSSQTTPDDAPSLVTRARGLSAEIVARIKQNLLVNVSLIATVVTSVFLLAYVLSELTSQPTVSAPTVTLEAALVALDANETITARHLATRLRATDLPADQHGGPAYVAGAALAHEADRFESPAKQRAVLDVASRYLEESAALGFPPGHTAHGTFLLGQSLFEIGRYDDAIAPLTKSITDYPREQSESRRMLVSALLKSTPRRASEALAINEDYLDDQSLTPAERSRALLTQAEILFEMGDDEACAVIVSQVPAGASEHARSLLIHGRLLMRQADALARDADDAPSLQTQAAEAYRAAAAAFRAAVDSPMRGNETLRSAHYLLGLAQHRRAGLLPTADVESALAEAADQLAYTRRVFVDTNEGIAASLEEGDALRGLGRHAEALNAYRELFEQAGRLQPYRNVWLPAAELRVRCDRVYDDYLASERYEDAIAIASEMANYFPLDHALQLQAEAYTAWGKSQLRQAVGLPRDSATALNDAGRSAYREAGELYAELARERYATRQYPEELWNSAENYRLGGDQRHAARIYERLLRNERRANHPRTLTALGEAFLALSQPEQALPHLMTCIEFFPEDPHIYRARNLAALAQRELGDFDAAEQLLLGNVEHELLDPDSTEGLAALFLMGELNYEKGLRHETKSRLLGVDEPDPNDRADGLVELTAAQTAFKESIQRLKEWLQRDALGAEDVSPQDRDRRTEQRIAGQYMIAESHRHSAKLPRKTLPGVTIDTQSARLRSQIRDDLEDAESGYQELIDTLVLRDDGARTPSEDATLRNCYFGRADVLFDLNRYTEAIDAYLDAAGHAEAEPAALEAHVQIANCYRQLDQLDNVKNALDTAKLTLSRIPPDAEFRRTTRYTRDEWVQLLAWLGQL